MPYAAQAGIQNGFSFNDSMSADFALMADINPGIALGTGDTKNPITVTFASSGADQRSANSNNHQKDGQNVLYADGHVDFSASCWAGAQNDNIYTARTASTLATADNANVTLVTTQGSTVMVPYDSVDTVLWPTDEN